MKPKVERRRSWWRKAYDHAAEKTIAIFFSDLRPVRAGTVWLYFFAAIGFQMSPQSSDVGLEFLLRVFDHDTWTLLFLYPCLARLNGLYIWSGNLFLRTFTASLGIWLWSLLLVSEVLVQPSFLSSLLIVAIATEVWIIAQYLTHRLDELKKHMEPPRVI